MSEEHSGESNKVGNITSNTGSTAVGNNNVQNTTINYYDAKNLPNQVLPGEQTIVGVWQWHADNQFSPTLELHHRASAIIFPINGLIGGDVSAYLQNTLHTEADILIVTSAAQPNVTISLDTAKPKQWSDVIESFKALLGYLKQRGSGPIHLFYNGPVALALALGASAGYNQHELHFHQWSGGAYHEIYQLGGSAR